MTYTHTGLLDRQTWRFRAFLALPVLALALACGGGGGGGGSNTSTGPRTVTGSRTWTYLPFSAGAIHPTTPEPATPSDPSTYIRAQLSDGTSLPGTYQTDTGAFSIPNVPAGHYWLVRANYDYILTDKSSVNLSVEQGGRRDVVNASEGTKVVFNIDNLSSWQENADDLQIFDYNAYLESWPQGAGRVTDGWPAKGATALSGCTVNWEGYPLLQPSKHDAPTLIQMKETKFGTVGDVWGGVAAREFTPTGLSDMPDKSTTTIDGTFNVVDQSAKVDINFDADAFNAAYTPVNPSPSAIANDRKTRLAYYDAPGFTDHGFLGAARLSLYVYGQQHNPSTYRVDAPVKPSGFERAARGEIRQYVDLKAPGATNAQHWCLTMRTYTLSLPTNSSPLLPKLGPVQAPKINATSLFNDQTITGLTPTVSWNVPALGAPQGYRVYVQRIYRSGTGGIDTAVDDVATIFVGGTQTQFQMPAGIFTPGNTYVLIIEARMGNGYDAESAPYLFYKFPYAWAHTISGLITTTP